MVHTFMHLADSFVQSDLQKKVNKKVNIQATAQLRKTKLRAHIDDIKSAGDKE